MIRYYQYEDLQNQKEIIKQTKDFKPVTEYVYQEVYRIPPSRTMPSGSRRRPLKKYDWIPEVKTDLAYDGQTIQVVLSVLKHIDPKTKKETYDIETFDGDYSDRLLCECWKDYLNFNKYTETQERNKRFAMINWSNQAVADILEKYAERNGRLVRKRYETIPTHLWILCIPYVSTHSKVLMVICLDCDSEEKYVYDIFLVDNYEELALKLKNSASKPKGVPHFCINFDTKLHEALRDEGLIVRATRDIQQIPVFINKVLLNPNIFRDEDKWYLERCRDKMCELLQKICTRNLTFEDRYLANREFQKVFKDFCSITFDNDTKKRFGKKIKGEILAVCNRLNNSGEDVKQYIVNGKNFHSMEVYRFLELFNKYKEARDNISAERMRLQLLCNYVTKNHVNVRKNWGSTTKLGVNDYTLSMMCDFDILKMNLPKWIKRTKIMFGNSERVYCIRNFRRFKRIKTARIDGKIIQPHIEYCHSYYLKLKLASSPILKQQPVTLGDMIKRLEKLMGLS